MIYALALALSLSTTAPRPVGAWLDARAPWAPEGLVDAVEGAADDAHGRALLLAVGWHESRFEGAVCSGERTADNGRAWGCWQSWDPDRSGGLRGQARRAADHLRRAGNYCAARGHDRVAGAVSLYATGRTCTWTGAAARVRTYRAILATWGR